MAEAANIPMKSDKSDVISAGTYSLSHPLDGTSWAVRENLHDILRRELLGPSDGEDELIYPSPVTKYVLGRIAPTKLRDPEGVVSGDDDELDPGAEDGELSHEAESDDVEGGDGEDRIGQDPAQKSGLMIPASMGLRFQVPTDTESVVARCTWGSYSVEDTGKTDAGGHKVTAFRRTPCAYDVTIKVDELSRGKTSDYTVMDEVTLRVDVLPDPRRGSLIMELALCNDRETPRRVPVDAWMFQTKIEVTSPAGDVFLPVADWMEDEDVSSPDHELERLRLQYRS